MAKNQQCGSSLRLYCISIMKFCVLVQSCNVLINQGHLFPFFLQRTARPPSPRRPRRRSWSTRRVSRSWSWERGTASRSGAPGSTRSCRKGQSEKKEREKKISIECFFFLLTRISKSLSGSQISQVQGFEEVEIIKFKR